MCGIFAVTSHSEAGQLVRRGLQALQHRGHESAGIVSFDGERCHAVRGMGWVEQALPAGAVATLPGASALGHVRYATRGRSALANAQPLQAELGVGVAVSVAHNGEFTNAAALREELQRGGALFSGDSDTEVLLHLMARAEGPPHARLAAALGQLEGAWALLVLAEGTLFAARDPRGFRPLCLGKKDGAVLAASESAALEAVGAKLWRDVAPGEIVSLDDAGRSSPPLPSPTGQCAFEPVYFARPDSRVFGANVYGLRRRLGARLAREKPVDAQLCLGVPDSGVVAALGFSETAGLPYEAGLLRNPAVGRTFIEPDPRARPLQVEQKLSAVRSVVEGKRVVVVDDSLVRGNTAVVVVRLLREAGAAQVHLRIASPPLRHPCFFGIHLPTRNELLASVHPEQELARVLGADSLAYLPLPALREELGGAGQHCFGCFDGHYPAPLPLEARASLH